MWFEFNGSLYNLGNAVLIYSTTYTKPTGQYGYVTGYEKVKLEQRSDPLPKIVLRRKDGGEVYLYPGSFEERDAVMNYLKGVLGAHSMPTDYDRPSNVGEEGTTWSGKLLDPAAQG